ncbi:uvrD/REP helicase domain protein [[Mycobacterium] chelonae subsp. bovistauri]|nr:uvrD/REP helicase domain protein [Mycobacterium sp. QIA-37]
MGDGAGLTGARSGEHADGTARRGDGGTLLIVETIEERTRHPAIFAATADNTAR